MNKQQIQEFVKSGAKELKFDTMLPVRTVEDALTEIGFEELDLEGDETNGWQVDFWYYFKSTTYGTYMLSGSLHYGKFKLEKQ